MFTLDDDIMAQLRATFRTEAAEHVQAMNNVLLALERESDQEKRSELLQEIFREAHSVKGAAGAADLPEVEATAHRLESVLDAARVGEIVLGPELCDVLYEAIDAVSAITEAALEGKPHGLNLDDLYDRLAAECDPATAGSAARSQPSAASAPGGGVPAGAVPAFQSGGTQVADCVPVSQRGEMQGASGISVPHEEPAHPEKQAGSDPGKPPTAPSPAGPGSASGRPAGNRGAGRGNEDTIRVATTKLDELMTQAGELLVAGLKIDQRVHDVEEASRSVEAWHREWLKTRASISHLFHDSNKEEMRPLLRFMDVSQQRLRGLLGEMMDLRRGFAQDALHLSRVTSDLGEGVMRVRMLPASTVFDTFPRMVRDLCRDLGKQGELEIQGGETELDRKVLEEIKDPLLHILRNAVDHGLEMPEVRARQAKSPIGKITLSAYQKGNTIVISVSDDGAGIDVDKVKRKALQEGLISADEVDAISDEEAMRLVFLTGLSTSAMLTDISGRGVGMDVVRRNVEALHGHVDLESALGQGTTTTMTLPLTLATTQELLVQVSDQTYGIPISAVERIQRINIDSVATVEGKETLVVDSEPVSLVHLAAVLELPEDADHSKDNEARADHKVPVVILKAGRKRIAFLVDAVVGQQESVVKSLGKQLKRVRNVAGATILGTGQVIMTLNPVDLVKTARIVGGTAQTARRARTTEVQQVQKRTILVVDDSLTTRNLEKTILETAGYRVKLATDGVEALSILRSDGCDVVVSDVLMPEMDGFDLTRSIREDAALRETPVILVTSLESRADKERGIEIGADAYIVKSTFDQESLLRAIEQYA